MLPITDGIYDFRTDVKEDIFNNTTGPGVTTANYTLNKALYDNDTSTVTVSSNNTSDSPSVTSYHSATRILDISGLAQSDNRQLTVSYDYDALNASTAISGILDKVPWIWLLCVIALAPAAIAVMLTGRNN